MKNKKGTVELGIILSILAFQAFIIVMLGFLDVSSSEVTTSAMGNSIFSFGNIVSNIAVLGWINTLVFSPLIIILVYAIADLIRG